jgi:hypothetical protein
VDYTDPYHKRIEFGATSFSSEPEDTGERVTFLSHNPHNTVTVTERGPQVAVTVSEEDVSLVLWKVQIIERLHWLILDFENNPILSRIVVRIERLNVNQLEAALRRVFGERKLLYFRQSSDESGDNSPA